MKRKHVVFIADSLDNAHLFQQVLSTMDVEVTPGSSLQVGKLLSNASECDLAIVEADESMRLVSQVESLLTNGDGASMLIIVRQSDLADFRLPVQVKSDFVVRGASADECAARIRQLLWPGNESSVSDFLTIDKLSINLATYQVKIGDEPLDFTYLEYALLAFLVTHPNRTYSRDALLRRVWGFDYYGGSRTVDVHVRRIRAKLGPELSQRLETVRGVGYLWSM